MNVLYIPDLGMTISDPAPILERWLVETGRASYDLPREGELREAPGWIEEVLHAAACDAGRRVSPY